ncbi:type VI secretion system baseplate subunit TssE [Paraburkholderia aspalathi]|uniref:type VI secretion system baseplate subunit TssE n=1 Tax=Paraburkholderia aspalathi TaxID=1324617 RepID=UPI0038B76549
MSRTDSRHRRAYLPSLLDRLQDNAPDSRHEEASAYALDSEMMSHVVQRDLNLLLNTTNLYNELDTVRYPAVAASVVNYGVPPISGNYLSSQRWETIEKLIRTAIIRFEPRLIPESIDIRPAEQNATRYNKLTFRIRGLMHWQPYPLEFQIQSTVDFEMNKVSPELER